MADGVEVRGKSIRIYFRYNNQTCREVFLGDATPENIERAKKLVTFIQYQIEEGTFNYAQQFPNSTKSQENTFGHYIDIWLTIKKPQIAASTYKNYDTKIKAHIRPRWSKSPADKIDHIDVLTWIQQELTKTLKNKTIKEIVTIMRQIFKLYQTRNKIAHDPTEGITVRLPDDDDPDPFTRQEIEAILTTPTDRYQELLMIKFMLWSGPRISEVISLAWEDVNLEEGTVSFCRAKVNGQYRVTKTRRSNREVKLLKPALDALKEIYQLTGHLKKQTIETTQRDNRTIKKESLRFVFLNSNTLNAHVNDFCVRDRFFKAHLKKAGVRYRGPNQCRHTFACQLLSTGAIPAEWISQQLGHTNPTTTFKYYAKWMSSNASDMVQKAEAALGI